MQRKFYLLIAVPVILFMAGCGSSTKQIIEDEMGFKHKSINKKIEITVSLKYLLSLPSGYDESKKYPLVIFLHGSGERGNNLNKVKKHGIPYEIVQGKTFPFIMVAPQCPGDDEEWNIYALNTLYQEIISQYNIDLKRVYLTGLSMGGYGTWKFAKTFPQYFAAIAPVCGGGNPDSICVLKDVPVWAFHGAKDNTVPIAEADTLVKSLKGCGGNVKFTIYPDLGHNSWTKTYSNPELYDWLLSQKKK